MAQSGYTSSDPVLARVRAQQFARVQPAEPAALGVVPSPLAGGDELAVDPTTGMPTWEAPPAAGMANPMTTPGDLIIGGTAGAAGRLAKGSDGQILTTDPTTHLPKWDAAPGAPSPGTWTDVTVFGDSWDNYGSGFGPARYRKDSLGQVYLDGIITNGTAHGSAFTLPVGFRPAYTIAFVIDVSENPGIVYIYASGLVSPSFGGSGTYGFLNQVTFLAEG
jgi:hypothetical protein